MSDEPLDNEIRPLRILLAVGGAVYLAWWFLVELVLRNSFNPLPGRLAVVAVDGLLLATSFHSRWVVRHLTTLFAAWICLLNAHYFYLVIGNRGTSTWWVGSFITIAATALCVPTRRQLIAVSIFMMIAAIGAASFEGQLGGSIYVPGLATILLVVNIAKRNQMLAIAANVQAERTRRDLDTAEEASRFKSMFLALVSHELLTPLQTIRLNSDALLQAIRIGGPERIVYIERVARAVSRLTSLIESLLEHARIESGKLAVAEMRFDLLLLVHESVDELSLQAKHKKIDLRLETNAPNCVVESDPRLVRLVLANLVTNAIKYTDQGSVEVAVRSDESEHRISVRDTGRGIPPEEYERIFDAFTQLEPMKNKHIPGLGLGLALVKEMTAAIGGRLEMSSLVESGSTFTLVLPRTGSPEVAQSSYASNDVQ